MSSAPDNRGAYLINGEAPRDPDDGNAPYWASALRQDVQTLSRDIKDLGKDFRSDVRDLGKEFRSGIRFQTVALVALAVVALAINAALILSSIRVSAPLGLAVEATNSAAAPVAAPVVPVEAPVAPEIAPVSAPGVP